MPNGSSCESEKIGKGGMKKENIQRGEKKNRNRSACPQLRGRGLGTNRCLQERRKNSKTTERIHIPHSMGLRGGPCQNLTSEKEAKEEGDWQSGRDSGVSL